MTILLTSILSELGIISRIEAGSTICRRTGKLQIVKHNITEGMQRRYNGESRQDALSIVDTSCKHAMEYSELLMESIYLSKNQPDELYGNKYREQMTNLERLMDGLKGANSGIEKMAKTYSSDETMRQELTTLHGCVVYQIQKIDRKLSLLKKSEQDHIQASRASFYPPGQRVNNPKLNKPTPDQYLEQALKNDIKS